MKWRCFEKRCYCWYCTPLSATQAGPRYAALISLVPQIGLAIEGGGMRGCVSAGMIAAIYDLGLMDMFDAVYGSSAGSLVGAYAIAGQVLATLEGEVKVASYGKYSYWVIMGRFDSMVMGR